MRAARMRPCPPWDSRAATSRCRQAARMQCDEFWSFVYSKARNVPEEHEGEWGYRDVWTRTAIDADTKLVPSWYVGTGVLRTRTPS